MLTPQEVSTHAFAKSMVGGYNMAMVDEFLDEVTDDYTALYKENAALKAKMKVLVEKVEDYRATEDSMRATLLAAQKMADSIVHEAESKRQSLLEEAEANAKERIAQLQKEIDETQARMTQGQIALAEFIAQCRSVCQKELESLEQLPQLPVDLPAPEEESPVSEIEETVLSAFARSDEVQEEAPQEQTEEPASQEEPLEDPFQRDPDATRRLNLDDLKFGRNYSRED